MSETQKHSSQPRNIAVVGAGLLGRLLAWRLSLLNHSVELFEAGSFTQQSSAAHTAAAMISPLSEVVISDRSIYELGLKSLTIWPEWIHELNQQSPTTKPVHYSAKGSVIVAHPQDHSELIQFKNDLIRKLGADDNSIWLDNAAIKNTEPQLDHFQQGLFLPNEAYLDNRQLLNNLFLAIKNRDVKCHEFSSVSLNKNDSSKETLVKLTSVESTLVKSTSVKSTLLNGFDWVIDCRGTGSKESIPSLRGVRGEVMWVETKEVQLSHPIRLCHPRYKLYVVPKPNNQYIIGATEIESEDSSPISLQSTLELSSALYTIHPAFSEARVIETDVNLRPAYLDNLPKIDVNERTISINGLYRHGYLLAPALIEQSLAFIK